MAPEAGAWAAAMSIGPAQRERAHNPDIPARTTTAVPRASTNGHAPRRPRNVRVVRTPRGCASELEVDELGSGAIQRQDAGDHEAGEHGAPHPPERTNGAALDERRPDVEHEDG